MNFIQCDKKIVKKIDTLLNNERIKKFKRKKLSFLDFYTHVFDYEI